MQVYNDDEYDDDLHSQLSHSNLVHALLPNYWPLFNLYAVWLSLSLIFPSVSLFSLYFWWYHMNPVTTQYIARRVKLRKIRNPFPDDLHFCHLGLSQIYQNWLFPFGFQVCSDFSSSCVFLSPHSAIFGLLLYILGLLFSAHLLPIPPHPPLSFLFLLFVVC